MASSAFTALPELWIPVIALSHVFSAIWLVRTWLASRTRPQHCDSSSSKAVLARNGSNHVSVQMPPCTHCDNTAVPGLDPAYQSRTAVHRGNNKDAEQCASPTHPDMLCTASSGAITATNNAAADSTYAKDVQAALDTNEQYSSTSTARRRLPMVGRVLMWQCSRPRVSSSSATGVAALNQNNAKHSMHVDKVEWQAVGCSYRARGAHKVVLQDIWGVAMSGEVQALMGPSGAGKSTLMDILAMRKSTGQLSGCVLLDGQPATPAFISHTAYIPQEDNFIPAMTSRETLTFYADITLPVKSSMTRRQRVEEVLAAVGLTAAANTLVGGCLPGGLMLRGLSGGERRRLSIAAGILAAPAVLFVDEPTSGLDSFAALSIMAQLQRIAGDARRVVICTIHQPRNAIWEMVDRVSLLACGRLMFHGVRAGIAPWFASLGYTRHHGEESDWLLDLVATGFDKPEEMYGNKLMASKDISTAAAAFLESYVQTINGLKPPSSAQLLQSTSSTSSSKGGADMPSLAGSLSRCNSLLGLGGPLQGLAPAGWRYPIGAGRQFMCLLRRHLLGSTRNPFDVAGRLLSCTYLGLIFGLVFYNTPADTLNGLRIRLNVCFTVTLLIALVPYMTISIYPHDRKVYLADASAKLYRPWTYYTSKVLSSLPFSLLGALAAAWTLYGMAGLRPGWQHVMKAGTLSSLLYLIALQVLHLASVVAPNQDFTFCLSIIWCVVNFAVSSFFVNFNEVTTNAWFMQLRYISAIYFALEGLMVNEFQGSSVDCSDGLEPGLASLAESALGGLSSFQQAMLLRAVQPQEGCIIHNDALLQHMQYSRPFGSTVAILAGYLCVLHGLTFLGMLLLANKEAR